MQAAFVFTTAVLVFLTLLPLWRHEHWLVRSLDFPRLQLLVCLATVLVLELFLLDASRPSAWSLFGAGFLCLAYHGWWILPYTRCFRVEVKASASRQVGSMISIMTANVLDTNRNAAALIGLVRTHAPDILVTLESESWWESQLHVLEPDYPFVIKCPLDNSYGMHVYSRLELADIRTEFLVEADKPSMHARVTLPSGCTILLYFLHPAPPSPTENDSSAPRDAELILVAKRVAGLEEPVIVTGDLNDVAWSETTRLFRKISGLLDPRVGRGMFNSFHAGHWFFRWPLDHLFHSHHFTLSRMRRLPAFGSDHFAIFAELVHEPAAKQEEHGLEADEDDLKLAAEKSEAVPGKP